MLNELICNTDLFEFLTKHELSQLRGTNLFLKIFIDKISDPKDYPTWLQKCRYCNPNELWEINKCPISCYRPKQKKWVMIYWHKKLPSIIPREFWNYFSKFLKGYMTLSKFENWHPFQQKPLLFPNNKSKWEVRMRVDIVGTFIHNEEDDYPEELRNIDEFVSVGVSIISTQDIHEGILGLNSFSIGWHSDDGCLYMDSLMINQGVSFGKGDLVEVVLNYSSGMLLFEKNSQLIHIHELSGEFLCNPLLFSVSCKTMNSLFFSIK